MRLNFDISDFRQCFMRIVYIEVSFSMHYSEYSLLPVFATLVPVFTFSQQHQGC